MKRLSLTLKIWLSIGIFVLGFVLSTLLVQLQGLEREGALRAIAESSFPEAQALERAEASFLSCLRAFNVAVVTEDPSLLDTAVADGRETVKELQTAAALAGTGSLREVAMAVRDFLEEAAYTYGAAARSPLSANRLIQARMHRLAAQGNDLKQVLQQANISWLRRN